MSWWDFGLLCGLALQALLLWRLVRVLRQLRQEDTAREQANFHLVTRAITQMQEHVNTANQQSAKACEGVRLLGAVDIGVLRDRGWLILCSRIGGRDWVKIQEIRPGMTMEEYKHLVSQLEQLGAEFKYFDSPNPVLKDYFSHR